MRAHFLFSKRDNAGSEELDSLWTDGTASDALLGDALLCPTFPLIFLCHLCIFLLIVTSPRRSALAAPLPESDGHVT